MIGNDIVDLREPGATGKARDRRFMDRVFTPAERGRILAAPSPTVALWKAWTAKETAFKIASRLREGVVFAHRRFEVGPDPGAGREGTLARTAWPDWVRVRFEDLEIGVRWQVTLDYIHCVGRLLGRARDGRADHSVSRLFFADIAHDRRPLGGALTDSERASVHSSASERARLLARRLLDRWNLKDAEIVRPRRAGAWGAPMVSQGGRAVAGFEVSLSHDGRFVAAALAGPATLP